MTITADAAAVVGQMAHFGIGIAIAVGFVPEFIGS